QEVANNVEVEVAATFTTTEGNDHMSIPVGYFMRRIPEPIRDLSERDHRDTDLKLHIPAEFVRLICFAYTLMGEVRQISRQRVHRTSEYRHWRDLAEEQRLFVIQLVVAFVTEAVDSVIAAAAAQAADPVRMSLPPGRDPTDLRFNHQTVVFGRAIVQIVNAFGCNNISPRKTKESIVLLKNELIIIILHLLRGTYDDQPDPAQNEYTGQERFFRG